MQPRLLKLPPLLRSLLRRSLKRLSSLKSRRRRRPRLRRLPPLLLNPQRRSLKRLSSLKSRQRRRRRLRRLPPLLWNLWRRSLKRLSNLRSRRRRRPRFPRLPPLLRKSAAPQPQGPQQAKEPEKTHVEKQKVENAYFFRIDGKDKQGHPASFDFIVLTDEYTWAKGSTTEVVAADKVVPKAEVADRVLTPLVRASLEGASDLIAVGLASQEGERAQEEARAADRAKTVVAWLKKVSKPDMTLWTLTLGQYDKACKQQEDADSSFERPVIFAGVRSKGADANLQEALADAISGHDNLPSRECYSRFDLEKLQ